jgi:hypothetical protein
MNIITLKINYNRQKEIIKDLRKTIKGLENKRDRKTDNNEIFNERIKETKIKIF